MKKRKKRKIPKIKQRKKRAILEAENESLRNALREVIDWENGCRDEFRRHSYRLLGLLK